MRAVLLAFALAATAACVSSTPGVVRTDTRNPLVSIGAGEVDVGGGSYWRAWYVIDRATQTCWLKLGDSGAALDCCALRKVPAAAPYIQWQDDVSCARPGQSPLATPPLP